MAMRRLMGSSPPCVRLVRWCFLLAAALVVFRCVTWSSPSTRCTEHAYSAPSGRYQGYQDARNVARTSGFHQISDEEIYVHSTFYDDRFRTKYIRIFGMQNHERQYTLRCRLTFDSQTKVELPMETSYPVFHKWPSEKLRYQAYYYGCRVPEVFDFSKNFTLTLTVEGSGLETDIPLHMTEEQRSRPAATRSRETSSSSSQDAVICVKAMWGEVNASRLVEWVEFNRLLGVKKIVIYDTTIHGPANRVLDYYQRLGVVDVRRFDFTLRMYTLMQHDPFRWQLSEDALLLEQTYLVSMNDCYYRYQQQAGYVLVIDQDEVIVPSKDVTFREMIQMAERQNLNASAFTFHTAWHLAEFGVGDARAPSYMHMQRYTRRSPVMQSQPKALISSWNAIVINWHGAVTMPDHRGLTGNQYLPAQRFGCVHHFRERCKYDVSKCAVLAQMVEQDEVITTYRDRMQPRIESVLRRTGLGKLLT